MTMDASSRPLLDPAVLASLKSLQPVAARGRVVQAFGTTLRVSGLRVSIGQQCIIRDPAQPHATALRAEVVGLREHDAILVPLGHLQGVSMGSEVQALDCGALVPVGDALLGRVLDAFGNPLDGQPLPQDLPLRPFQSDPPNPLERRPIDTPFVTVSERSTGCSPWVRGSGWVYLPWPAAASPPCWACWPNWRTATSM